MINATWCILYNKYNRIDKCNTKNIIGIIKNKFRKFNIIQIVDNIQDKLEKYIEHF